MCQLTRMATNRVENVCCIWNKKISPRIDSFSVCPAGKFNLVPVLLSANRRRGNSTTIRGPVSWILNPSRYHEIIQLKPLSNMVSLSLRFIFRGGGGTLSCPREAWGWNRVPAQPIEWQESLVYIAKLYIPTHSGGICLLFPSYTYRKGKTFQWEN